MLQGTKPRPICLFRRHYAVDVAHPAVERTKIGELVRIEQGCAAALGTLAGPPAAPWRRRLSKLRKSLRISLASLAAGEPTSPRQSRQYR